MTTLGFMIHQTPGFYQIRKGKGTSDSRYLEQIFLAKEQQAPLNSARDDFVGVITHAALHDSVDDGDVVNINQFRQLRVILSRRANHNTLLVTERCNNLCLFCSQPPRE